MPRQACGCVRHAHWGRRGFLRGAGAGLMVAGLAPFARAASGSYEAMLFACIDPRFVDPAHEFMTKAGLDHRYSQVNLAGAAVAVEAPAFEAWRQTYWDNLGTSVQLHGISRVIVVDHRDCGAAEIAFGEDVVKDPDKETAAHRQTLMNFRDEVAKRFPQLGVEGYLMALDGTSLKLV